MARHFITIAGRKFVAHDDDIEQIRRSLLGAVRTGGDFVALTVGGAQVDVLVTAGLPVFIEKHEEPELAAAGAATAEAVTMPADEFDDWGI